MINAKAITATAAMIPVILLSAPARSADVEYGEELFSQHCAACHTVIAGVTDKSGPNLNSVIGRTAGTAEYSFGYSEGMGKSGIVWDPEMLDQFLKNPARTVPVNKMVFAGLPDAEDRGDLLAYLQQFTNN